MIFFISAEKTLECLVCAVIFTACLAGMYTKPLGIVQSSGYSAKKTFGWLKKKGNLAFTRLYLLAMMCALACAVLSLSFAFTGEWAAVVGFVSYVILFVAYIFVDKRYALRSPAVFTPRLKRLYVLSIFFTLVFSYFAIALLNFISHVAQNEVLDMLRYTPLAVFPLLVYPIIALSNTVGKLYEVPHNRKFIEKAGKKISSSKVTVIGITGSFGKTSTKHILSSILSTKYRVLSTPRSHNTPIGLALTVNGVNLDDYDFFIAEMGARHVGDIAELCMLCPPDYSIITGICPQHLESFITEENIIKAKGEILSATKKEGVIGREFYDLFKDYPCKISPADCVTDVSSDSTGTSFTLTLGGESAKIKTRLLGRHSAENIAVCAKLCFMLGMSLSEIAAACNALDFVEHRLQLLNAEGVNIIDDGYNSNIRGAHSAIEVLNSFGGRKIAVTPGLVELGILEESENEKLGEELVGLDRVILVGDTLVTCVKRGYLNAGGDEKKLTICPTLDKAKAEIKKDLDKGDTILFLNDLPDLY